MPRFRTEMRFAWDIPGLTPRRWRNTLFIDAVSPLAACTLVNSAAAETLRDGYRERVWHYETYATDEVEGTDVYAVVPVTPANQRGNLPWEGGYEPYLPKVCLAVTLSVTGSRPSRKFFRPGLAEGDITAGTAVAPALVSAVSAAWDNFVAALGSALVDPDGQPVLGVQRIKLSTREFGRESTVDVPLPPPLG